MSLRSCALLARLIATARVARMSEAISGTGFRTYRTRMSLRSCGLLARLIATASVARMSEAISGTGFQTYRTRMSLRSCGLLARLIATASVARMERSEIRDSRDTGPGLRFAPSGLQRRDLPVGRFVEEAVESFFRIFRKIFVAT